MYKYLDTIKSPQDIKSLNLIQLEKLCSEIRIKLVETVSESGGHLASNLGVVELTVALHRVLNAPEDKIVWDVGHQSYVHKILTGRMNEMNTIRSIDGLCGFTNPKESEYDVSYSGHASASLSTAAGLAEARDINEKNYEIATVIGDGAFTGGLAFEALNNIGNSKSKMLIILNDNEMSIAENVGAFSAFLSKARTNRKYTSSKRKIVQKIQNMPGGGQKLMHTLRKIKRRLKSILAPNVLFEQFGITYLGPVNGHSISDMEELFRRAIELNEPVLVHVITKKGKGYMPAERNPEIFHGIGSFDKVTGAQKRGGDTYSNVFGRKLCALAAENSKIVAITPAMIPGSGLKGFAEKYPKRLYDVGIAEGYAVTFAGGIACGGGIPIVAVYSTFLQRAYDNLIHDVALGNYHVVFAVDRAGLVPGDGATHQGLFDISYLTVIPNMTLLAPSSFCELQKMLEYAVKEHNAPIAIRYPRGGEAAEIDNGEFILSKASVVKKGSDISIVAEGQCVSMALKAAQLLEKRNIMAEVVDVRTIKPLDFDTVLASAEKCGRMYSIEENLRRGGMGEMIASEALVRKIKCDMKICAVDDLFVCHGTYEQINSRYGFTPEKIAEDIERMLKA